MTGSNVSDGSTPGSDGASVSAPMVLTLPDTPDSQVAAITLRGQRDLSLRAHPPGTVLSAGPCRRTGTAFGPGWTIFTPPRAR